MNGGDILDRYTGFRLIVDPLSTVYSRLHTPGVVVIGSFGAAKPQIFGYRRDLGGEGGREREGPAGGRGTKGDGTG